jgi:hypothetical protein
MPRTPPITSIWSFVSNIASALDRISAAAGDSNFTAVAATINGLLNDLGTVIRSDNQLMDQIVTMRCLGLDVIAALAGSGGGWQPKQPVLCATTGSNITLSGEQTLDGITTNESRVLVKDQSNPAQNAIYVSGSGAWTLAPDFQTAAQQGYAVVGVSSGLNNANTTWVCGASVASITPGTTALPFYRIGAPSGEQQFNVVQQTLTGTLITPNINIGAMMVLALSGNTTFDAPTMTNGQTAIVQFTQPASGSPCTVTFSGITFMCGAVPQLTQILGAVDTLYLRCIGGVVRGNLVPETTSPLTPTQLAYVDANGCITTSTGTGSGLSWNPASGLTVTGANGGPALAVVGAGASAGATVNANGAFSALTLTSNSSRTTLVLTDTGGNGCGLQLVGNGASTPSKMFRVIGGLLQIVNDAYTDILWQMDDSGNINSNGALAQNGQLTVTTTGSNGSLVVVDTGSNGGNIKIIGNGASTPSKHIRVNSGVLQIINDAYSGTLWSIDDSGNVIVHGNQTVNGAFAHVGTLFGIFSAAAQPQPTGYGTPTGGARISSFAAGSVTLAQLAGIVAQLILDVKSLGVVGV